MSVGVLLVTHENIGSSLLESLELIWEGPLPLPVKVLPIRHENDPDEFRYHAEIICKKLNEGQGVLVLTDLLNATPCRIASKLISHCRVRVVAGINLPMLVKIMNYYKYDLDKLANIALSGGCQGVLDVNSVLNK
jgi:PTS system ascorbate-specific IIA component